jgi:hypothetical protein
MELGEKGKGKENDKASVILYNIRCENRGYKRCVLKGVENFGVGGKVVRESNGRD